jgi:hypothetical protein
MILNTGKKTKKGQEIKVGDIIKGSSTHPSVVCINTKYPYMGEYVTVLIDYETIQDIMGEERKYRLKEGFTFPLDEMINSWSDLEVIGNIIIQ